MKIAAIVMDIEGTTSGIGFVQNVLYPYSLKHIGPFLRERIEAELPQNYGALATYAQSRRDKVKAALATPARRALWERFLDSAGNEAVLRGALGSGAAR